MLEEGQIVDGGEGEALAVIERRTGTFGGQVLKILSPAGGGIGRVDFGGGIVDSVAPGLRPDESKAVAEAAGELVSPAMIGGIAAGHESGDEVLKAGVSVSSGETVLAL